MPPEPNGNGQPRKTRRVQPGDAVTPGPPREVPAPPPAAFGPGQAAPQPVQPSMELLQSEFERLINSNGAKFQELIKQGNPPDPMYLVHARINHLIDAIAQATGPNGPRWAMQTRIGFERQIATELDALGPQSRLMQLAEGGRYTPAMIAALAAQTGNLRQRT